MATPHIWPTIYNPSGLKASVTVFATMAGRMADHEEPLCQPILDVLESVNYEKDAFMRTLLGQEMAKKALLKLKEKVAKENVAELLEAIDQAMPVDEPAEDLDHAARS